MVRIALAEIDETCRDALTRHGAPGHVADLMARQIAWCEARGNRVCGLAYLESYCLQLRSGRVRGDAVPRIDQPAPGTLAVDARHGFAQVAFAAVEDRVVDLAREQGIAQLAVGHCHTATALGWFTEAIAERGVVALAVSNASPIVAAPGGTDRIIGTNPIAFACPDGSGGVGMAFDQATTNVTLGAVVAAGKAGDAIPEGWALDAAGFPTTDPDAALKGSLVSAGGPKGWGLGLMVELLAAGMTGGQLGHGVQPLKAPEGPPHDLGFYLIAIRPGPGMADRFARLLALVDADPKARMPGRGRLPHDPVRMPDALWDHCLELAR